MIEPAAVGLAGAVVLATAFWGLRELRTPERLAALIDEADSSAARPRPDLVDRVLTLAGAPLRPILLRLVSARAQARAAGRILAAGSPAGLTPASYLQMRSALLLGGAVGAVTSLLSGALVQAVVWSGVGWYLIDAAVTVTARHRQEAVERQVPDVLDLLVLLTQAGVAFTVALERAAAAVPAPLGHELTTMSLQLKMGYSVTSGLTDLVRRNPAPTLRRVVNALLDAAATGSPVSQALAAMAQDFRSQSLQAAKKRAGRNSVLVILVVTVLALPAALLMAVGMVVFGGVAGQTFSGLLP